MSTGQITVIEPTLVKVSVLGGNTQIDIGLPAAVPVAALIGDLVAHVRSRAALAGPVDADPDPHSSVAVHWSLAPVGGQPLSPERSLAEAGVRDGDLLLLTAADPDEAPALFDDVVDAIALITDDRFQSWSPRAARMIGQGIALTSVAIAAIALALTRGTDMSSPAVAVAGACGLGFLIAAAVLARHTTDDQLPPVASAAAMMLAFVFAALLVPSGSSWSSPAFGCAAVALVSLISYRLTAAGPTMHSAATTASLLGAAAFTVAMTTDASAVDLAAVTAAVGFLTVTLASRLTIVLARLPLPPVPTAGDAAETIDSDPTTPIEGIAAIGAVALPDAEAIERRAHTAVAYLRGIICGATVVTVFSAVATAWPTTSTDPRTTLTYSLVLGLVMCLRGRSNSDIVCACALVIGGTTVLLTLVGGAIWQGVAGPSGTAYTLLIVATIAVTLAVGALVIGVVAAGHEFSPVMRRSAELGEYLLVATIVPLLIWILSLYDTVRNLG